MNTKTLDRVYKIDIYFRPKISKTVGKIFPTLEEIAHATQGLGQEVSMN